MKKFLPLKKKYNLPEYDELNKYFDIEEIESSLILQKIRIKICEKFDFYAKLIETILQPESNLSTLYEAKYLNEQERDHLYNLFKELMYIIRKSNIVSVENSEERNAEFINYSYKRWLELKKDLEIHFSKISEVWKKETNIQNDLSYFG